MKGLFRNGGLGKATLKMMQMDSGGLKRITGIHLSSTIHKADTVRHDTVSQ